MMMMMTMMMMAMMMMIHKKTHTHIGPALIFQKPVTLFRQGGEHRCKGEGLFSFAVFSVVDLNYFNIYISLPHRVFFISKSTIIYMANTWKYEITVHCINTKQQLWLYKQGGWPSYRPSCTDVPSLVSVPFRSVWYFPISLQANDCHNFVIAIILWPRYPSERVRYETWVNRLSLGMLKGNS